VLWPEEHLTDTLPQLARAHDVLRPGGLEPGKKTLVHLDGLTREQRYEQRTNMKDSLLAQGGAESCEQVGTTESDILSQGSGEAQTGVVPCEIPELHVSDVRGTVYPKTACDPSVPSRRGGTCSVPERLVSDGTCVNSTGSQSGLHNQRGLGGASHRLEGKPISASMPASSACERSPGPDARLACERTMEEVKRMHGHG
jgi:hypothetical protein